jgi:hypothetical protein
VDYANPLVFKKAPVEPEPEQEVKLVAQAKGFSPQEHSVFLRELTNRTEFVINAGSVFRGHVVDETGEPITNAVVRTDWDFEHQIPTRFEWTAKTDSSGAFEWDSAPQEPLCFWFEADGHQIVRGQLLAADGSDHVIVLKRTH